MPARIRHLAALALAVPLTAGAQGTPEGPYPSRPMRFLVGFSAGGGSDFAARIVAQRLSEVLSQSVVIDNRTGANGAIAADMAAKAPADGYTLFLLAPAHMTANAASLAYPNEVKLPYDLQRDFRPVSQLTQQPYLAVIPASIAPRTLKEFIDFVRAKPGQYNYASTGIAGSNHLAAELFTTLAGLKMGHVIYKGPPQALTEIAGGQIEFMVTSIQTGLPLLRAGKLRALGVTSRERSNVVPDVPPVQETLPGYYAVGWYGLLVPKATPAAIVDRLAAAVAQGMKTAEVRARVASDGSEVVASSPTETERELRSELERYRKLIVDAKIKVQ